MSVRSVLTRLLPSDRNDMVVECRNCGMTLSQDADECTECGSDEIGQYRISD